MGLDIAVFTGPLTLWQPPGNMNSDDLYGV